MRRTIWRRFIGFRTLAALIGLLLAVSLMFAIGCGGFSKAGKETKQLYKGLSGSPGTYKQIMVFLPVENDVQWLPADLYASFAPKLRDIIQRECKHLRTILPPEPNFPDRFDRAPRLPGGALDSANLAAIAKASGVNLVLSGRLVDIHAEKESRGILWFKKAAHLMRVQIEVAVYHTGTGAKVIDKTVFKDIDVTEAEAARIDEGQIPDLAVFRQTLTDVAATMGEAVCNVLSHIPWEGYVTSVKDSQIVLSSGEACGLKKGATLRVYSTQVEAGQEGAPGYTALGKEIGTITITAVDADHSQAVLKSGGPIVPGNIVQTN